jgi:hypothetical protein
MTDRKTAFTLFREFLEEQYVVQRERDALKAELAAMKAKQEKPEPAIPAGWKRVKVGSVKRNGDHWLRPDGEMVPVVQTGFTYGGRNPDILIRQEYRDVTANDYGMEVEVASGGSWRQAVLRYINGQPGIGWKYFASFSDGSSSWYTHARIATDD